MAKKDKIITFRQQNHIEYVKDVFNMIFVVACFICVTKALFSAPVEWIFTALPTNSLTICLKIIAKAVYWGVGLFTPFIIYRIIKYRNVEKYFVRKKTNATPLHYLLGILCVLGLGFSLVYYSSFIVEAMRADGFLVHERTPEIGNNLVTYAVFILVSTTIGPLFQELTFRGIIMSDLRKDTQTFAVIISALICAFSNVSFQIIPYLLITGLVLGWLYIKTNSIFLTFTANAVMSGTLAVFWIIRQENAELYGQIMPILAPIALFIGIISFLIMILVFGFTAKENKGALSRKDCFKGFFGSFALWIFIFISVFEVFFLYIDKPRKKEETTPPESINDIVKVDPKSKEEEYCYSYQKAFSTNSVL